MTHDDEIDLLVGGAVLTRMFCAELKDCRALQGNCGKRVRSAARLLFQWVEARGYSRPSLLAYALKSTDVGRECFEVLQELLNGATVCDDYEVLMSADYSREADEDWARLQEHLASYWSKHGVPALLS